MKHSYMDTLNESEYYIADRDLTIRFEESLDDARLRVLYFLTNYETLLKEVKEDSHREAIKRLYEEWGYVYMPNIRVYKLYRKTHAIHRQS